MLLYPLFIVSNAKKVMPCPVNAEPHFLRNHKKPISLALTGKITKRCDLEVCPASSSDYGAPGVFQTIRIIGMSQTGESLLFIEEYDMICKSMGWTSFQIHSNSGDFETIPHSRFRSCKNRCCDGFGLQRCTMILQNVSQAATAGAINLTNANQRHTVC